MIRIKNRSRVFVDDKHKLIVIIHKIYRINIQLKRKFLSKLKLKYSRLKFLQNY